MAVVTQPGSVDSSPVEDANLGRLQLAGEEQPAGTDAKIVWHRFLPRFSAALVGSAVTTARLVGREQPGAQAL